MTHESWSPHTRQQPGCGHNTNSKFMPRPSWRCCNTKALLHRDTGFSACLGWVEVNIFKHHVKATVMSLFTLEMLWLIFIFPAESPVFEHKGLNIEGGSDSGGNDTISPLSGAGAGCPQCPGSNCCLCRHFVCLSSISQTISLNWAAGRAKLLSCKLDTSIFGIFDIGLARGGQFDETKLEWVLQVY